MPISVPCTGCGKVLQVRDSAAGIRAQCSHCGDMIQIPKLKARPPIEDLDAEPAAPAKVTYEPTPHNGFKLAGEDRCLACGETIKTGLPRCPYCGTKIAPPPRKPWWRRSQNWWSNPQEQDLTLEDIALCFVAAPLMFLVGLARKCRGHRTANSILTLAATGLVLYLVAIIAFRVSGLGQKPVLFSLDAGSRGIQCKPCGRAIPTGAFQRERVSSIRLRRSETSPSPTSRRRRPSFAFTTRTAC